uniref:Uncharacterized protein n=1 Tax=Amphimedon queenslandica TaxID=400682 RepID=A0A1X7V1E2_AMPQE
FENVNYVCEIQYVTQNFLISYFYFYCKRQQLLHIIQSKISNRI